MYVLHTPHPGRNRPNDRTSGPLDRRKRTPSPSGRAGPSARARGRRFLLPRVALRSSIERKKPGSAPSPSNTRVCGEDLLTHVSGIAQALVWSRLRHHTSKILSKVLFGRAPDQDVATNCGVRRAPLGETRDARHVRRPPSSSRRERAPHRRSPGARRSSDRARGPAPPARVFVFAHPTRASATATASEARAAYAAAAAASRHQRAALHGSPGVRDFASAEHAPAASRPKNTKDSYMLFHPQYDLDASSPTSPRGTALLEASATGSRLAPSKPRAPASTASRATLRVRR